MLFGKKRKKYILPEITDKYLHEDHGEFSERVGGGKNEFVEGGTYYKNGNYDKAINLLQTAITKQLTMPYESCALKIIAVCYIKKQNLPLAVENFLKCLEVPCRHTHTLGESLTSLYLIYKTVGRTQEANTIKTLMDKLNLSDIQLNRDFENDITTLLEKYEVL